MIKTKTHNIISLLSSLALALLAVFQISLVQAGGGPPSSIRFTPSTPSTIANGSAKITVDVYSFFYKCNSGNYGSTLSECDAPTQGGYSGVEVVWPNETTNISADAGLTTSVSSVTTDGSAHASFNVTSTKIGTYNIYAKTSSGYVVGQKSLTFTDPNPTPAPTPVPTAAPTPLAIPAPAQQSTPTAQSAPKETTQKPEVPVTKLVDTEGKELVISGDEPIMFKDKDPIIVSGTTIPNGIVKLYIFSEPQEATVTADNQGNWSYTIASIEPGNHRVEVEVTDPESGETSERAKVLFQVTQANTTNEIDQNTTQDNSFSVVTGSNTPEIITAVGAILAVLVLALLIVSKMHPINYVRHLIRH